ncbi:hypothetical protein, partial [Streptosporangium vulgare]|uniref:hypothetical protein n=1 Tax=Streptosporangium vulgare TaxID=46190 RepID=UPI0031DA81F3
MSSTASASTSARLDANAGPYAPVIDGTGCCSAIFHDDRHAADHGHEPSGRAPLTVHDLSELGE